jgi:hypothetical protein
MAKSKIEPFGGKKAKPFGSTRKQGGGAAEATKAKVTQQRGRKATPPSRRRTAK